MMTIAEAGEALRTERVSSVELTQECLDQVGKLNPDSECFHHGDGRFRTGPRRRAGWRTGARYRPGTAARNPYRPQRPDVDQGHSHHIGVEALRGFVPDRDAAVVERLAEAGAVMIGKAGLHEIAYGITSDNPHFGTIRNPRNPEYSPGGSSGGSGVAVATGMAFVATGTDTGGSIRVPASFCGVVGLKPTYGLIDRSGVQPLGVSLDHVGPLARTVDDVRFSLRSDAGFRSAKDRARVASRDTRGSARRISISTRCTGGEGCSSQGGAPGGKLGVQVIPIRVPDIEALNTAGLVILLGGSGGGVSDATPSAGRFRSGCAGHVGSGLAGSGGGLRECAAAAQGVAKRVSQTVSGPSIVCLRLPRRSPRRASDRPRSPSTALNTTRGC